MDILEFLEDATKEADAFENHPIKDFSLEDQLLYLQGLALVMNADGAVHEDEKEYLRILIKSFDMDQSSLESLVEFANQPDKDTIQAFFKTYRRKPIAQLFLFDTLMMTRRDEVVHDKEMAVVNKMADQLEILKGTQKDIYDLFCFIKNKNWAESALYFSSHLLNPDHFKHLLDYHGLDMDEVLASAREFRLDRLKAAIQRKVNLEQYSWEPISYLDGSKLDPKETEITTEFLKQPLFTSELYLSLMQAKLDRGELRIEDGIAYQGSGTNVYASLKDLDLLYDQENMALYINPEILKERSDDAEGKSRKYSEELIKDITKLFGNDIDVNKPSDINKVLKPIFGSVISYGRKYGSSDFDIKFPSKQGNNINQIVLGHSGRFYNNPQRREYISSDSPALDMNIIDVLNSGRFRLMRTGKK
ncbi:TerB family tellurite resistance protein [Litoribrevibacter albus]|uniref:Co-chaperone DjlA N-terminal domain-containing protein n=1 Tax=Litoribrevibacter albus TaxID=1473156 RepID=A0AA37S8N7_9GAMM|nr:TerB family tellurite resistance protein [Litoribrevibacter albus]GLQ30365.1 hypothetical protein GCM10007876_08430 [Litoribrevibacter albus]